MALLPGDLKQDEFIRQLIRVNHAGELGAKRIYEGQLAVLKYREDKALVKEMLAQEEKHLEYFSQEMKNRNVRPSFFTPLWNMLGFALGAGTAALGKTSAMVCTEAVEEVIDEHYKSQLEREDLPKDLAQSIEKFRLEELEHHDVAQKNRCELGLGHEILYKAIKFGCRASIAIAKKF